MVKLILRQCQSLSTSSKLIGNVIQHAEFMYKIFYKYLTTHLIYNLKKPLRFNLNPIIILIYE